MHNGRFKFQENEIKIKILTHNYLSFYLMQILSQSICIGFVFGIFVLRRWPVHICICIVSLSLAFYKDKHCICITFVFVYSMKTRPGHERQIPILGRPLGRSRQPGFRAGLWRVLRITLLLITKEMVLLASLNFWWLWFYLISKRPWQKNARKKPSNHYLCLCWSG